MRRLFIAISLILLTFFAYGVYLSVYRIRVFPENILAQNHHLFFDFRGITHSVTKHTRGSLFPKDILLEATEAKVDYLFLTDLNLLNKQYNINGYHGNVLTFTNQKVSFLDSHVIVYSGDEKFRFNSLDSAHAILTEHFAGNSSPSRDYFTVIAHPFKRGHGWHGKMPPGMDGIEVLNLRKLWQDVWLTEKPTFLWSIFTYPFNPDIALLRLLDEPEKELDLWDQMSQQSRTLGFIGNQTTSRIFNVLGANFAFPSYYQSFSFAANHVLLQSELTGNDERDREKIFDSLKKGHFYFSLDMVANPKGFASYIQTEDQLFLMGDDVPFKEGMEISVDLPEKIQAPFVIELFRDGYRIATSEKEKSTFPVQQTGVYRVVVRLQPQLPFPDGRKWISWIYTNPFFVH